MKGNRLWVLGTVAAVAAIVLIGWLLGISPRLAEAAAAGLERQNVDALNAAQAAEIATLREQSETFGELEEELDELRTSIPDEALSDAFIDEVASAAAAAGVTVASVTFSEPGPWGVSAAPEGAPVAESEPGAESPPFPTAPEGVYTMSVSVTLRGEPGQVAMAALRLQMGERVFVITDFVYDADNDLEGTLSGYLLIIRDPNAPPPASDDSAEDSAGDSADGGSTELEEEPISSPSPTESPTPAPTPSP